IASPDDPGVELVITGAGLEDARVGFDQLGSPEIQFQIKPEAAERFAQYTGDNIDSYLSIALDGLVIQTAVIRAQISTSGSISGSLNSIRARNVAIQLRYGALPVPLRVEQNLTIGPTLGQESLDRSVRAGIVGAILVTLFMVAYYRLPGLVAAVALALYTALVLAIFKLIPVTLTLSGIAGFILSVGMAVDANILIFERSKEELRGGLTLTAAIQIGFSRAWNSIRDSNVSTLITCFVLWQFGSGIVRGFALTLAIGVLVSMFSAITVSRTMLLLLVRWPRLRNATLFGIDRISGVRA
ncbi:MAG TPA: protein translocase subunit SecD, partial [Chloroflexota bacterium]|nr:protein translocase subunit SecD [Chloroflexota bacterium]